MSSLLLGTGWVQPLSHTLLVSPEIVYGYSGHHSTAFILNAAMRIVSNVSLQISPGYLSTDAAKTPLIAIGFSISTADFDYNERSVEKKTGFHVPTIEELDQQIKDGEKEKSASPDGSGNLVPDNEQNKSMGDLLEQQGKKHE